MEILRLSLIKLLEFLGYGIAALGFMSVVIYFNYYKKSIRR